MKELNYLSRFAQETFALLPTQEELVLRFPHAQGCRESSPLTATNEFVFLGIDDPRVGSIGVRSYFLQCDDCHTAREYRKT